MISNIAEACKRARWPKSDQGFGIDVDVTWQNGSQTPYVGWEVTVYETNDLPCGVPIPLDTLHETPRLMCFSAVVPSGGGVTLDGIMRGAGKHEWMTGRHLHSLRVVAEAVLNSEGQKP